MIAVTDAVAAERWRSRRRAFTISAALHALALAAVLAFATVPPSLPKAIFVELLSEPETAGRAASAAPTPPIVKAAPPAPSKPRPPPRESARVPTPTLRAVEPTHSAGASEPAVAAVAPAPSAAAVADRVFGEAEVDRVAAPVGAFAPRYPSRELQTGRQGTVVLSATVDTSGRVREVAVVKSAGGNFDTAARAAVEATPFRAAEREGRAVPSSVTVRVKFKLD